MQFGSKKNKRDKTKKENGMKRIREWGNKNAATSEQFVYYVHITGIYHTISTIYTHF